MAAITQTVAIVNRSGKVVKTVRSNLLKVFQFGFLEKLTLAGRANILSTSSKKLVLPTANAKPNSEPPETPNLMRNAPVLPLKTSPSTTQTQEAPRTNPRARRLRNTTNHIATGREKGYPLWSAATATVSTPTTTSPTPPNHVDPHPAPPSASKKTTTATSKAANSSGATPPTANSAASPPRTNRTRHPRGRTRNPASTWTLHTASCRHRCRRAATTTSKSCGARCRSCSSCWTRPTVCSTRSRP